MFKLTSSVVAAALLNLIFTSAPMVGAFAANGEVIVNGKHYMQLEGKLYLQTKGSEWTDQQGVKHESWVTDYSTWVAPKNVPHDYTTHPMNLKKQEMKLGSGSVDPTGGKATKSSDPASAIAVKDVGNKHYLTIGADMLFDFDKYTLTPKAESVLKVLGPMLQKYGNHPVEIAGHTDAIGTDEYNQTLSEQRAKSVKDWLVAHDFVGDEKASTKGCGKSSPVAPNTYNDGTDFPQGRAKNRRVEVSVDCSE